MTGMTRMKQTSTIKFKILVIEDVSIARKMAKVAFEANECKVDCVTTGKDAIAKIKEGYDLVLLDLDLPDMDGLELAKILREQGDNNIAFAIVALTAHTEKKEATKKAGIDGFMAKPLTMRKCESLLLQFCQKQSA